MVKVSFIGLKKMILAEASRTEHVVTLRADNVPQKTTGFLIYKESDGRLLGDYSGFTTIYRVLDDGVQFSDDGSIWVEPEPQPEPEPMPPTPVGPTWNDTIEAQVMYTAMMTDTLIEE